MKKKGTSFEKGQMIISSLSCASKFSVSCFSLFVETLCCFPQGSVLGPSHFTHIAGCSHPLSWLNSIAHAILRNMVCVDLSCLHTVCLNTCWVFLLAENLGTFNSSYNKDRICSLFLVSFSDNHIPFLLVATFFFPSSAVPMQH